LKQNLDISGEIMRKDIPSSDTVSMEKKDPL